MQKLVMNMSYIFMTKSRPVNFSFFLWSKTSIKLPAEDERTLLIDAATFKGYDDSYSRQPGGKSMETLDYTS